MLPQLEKGEKLPKLADLLINELFVALEEGEFFSTRIFSSCGTKVRNCAAILSQLNTPTDNEFITVGNITNYLLET